MDASAGDASLPFLSLTGISKRFGGTMALDGIDWSVDAGRSALPRRRERVGEVDPDQDHQRRSCPGSWRFDHMDGSRYSSLTPQLAKSLGVQVIFQDLSLFPNLSVLENIAIDCELRLALASAAAARHARRRVRRARAFECAAPSRCQGRDAPGRAAPDRRHLSRAGRQCADPIHGRTDCVAHATRGRIVAGDRAPAQEHWASPLCSSVTDWRRLSRLPSA